VHEALRSGSTILIAMWSAFALLMALACVEDLRTRRIPNALVVGTLVLGVGASTVIHPPLAGLLAAMGGIAVGLVLWLPFYAMGMVGAGDVKLFAAASAWLGPHGAIEAAALTAFAGGAIAIVALAASGTATNTVFRLVHAIRMPALLRAGPTSRFRRLPYAFAIAIGVATAAAFPGIIW
jgi:prepilin peptidase CpaA